jgi:hypothetical protein
MPRYRVTIRARVWTYSALEVEAKNGNAAVRRAFRLRRAEDPEPQLKEGEDIGEFCDSSAPEAFSLHNVTKLDDDEG